MTQRADEVRDLLADFAFDVSMIVLAAKSAESDILKATYLDKIVQRTKQLSHDVIEVTEPATFPAVAT